MFNVVTGVDGVPHAVLVRAIDPLAGVTTMCRRRGHARLTPALTAGPGSLCRALGIRTAHTGTDLRGDAIWLADDGTRVPARSVTASMRVGVAYAGAYARRPWRFRVRGNPFTSRAT
jgi:DNA-3-methyladenine glycosylase